MNNADVVIKVIKHRRSIRKYKPDPITKDELDTILEAAIWAPTAHNDQPWHFTVLRNKKAINDLADKVKTCMQSHRMEWVRSMGSNANFHVFYHAPVVIVVSGRENAVAPFADCCAAIQNMLLMAESMGIGSCWIGLAKFLFDEDPATLKTLRIPEGYEPNYCITLGYKAVAPVRGPLRKKNVITFID